jgi:hypothetical protein
VRPLTQFGDGFTAALAEWRRVPWDRVTFTNARVAILAVVVLLAVTLLRMLMSRSTLPTRRLPQIFLPALLPAMSRQRLVSPRHTPFAMFLLGLPFLAIALADPRSTLRHDDVTYPGRRIAIVIDGSTSMIFRFPLSELKIEGGDHAYYAAVGGAERFLRLRMGGPYRDVMALIQFGDQAYVITPFTTDYSNVLLALRLMSSPDEWGHFPDSGTTIIKALEEAVSLFDRFQFQSATGNMMVIFTDGRDDQMELRGETLDELCRHAATSHIPMYFVRTAYASQFGDVRQDAMWQSAAERTGGRFYVASDEPSLLNAIDEINRLSPGRVALRTYSADRPEYHAALFTAICLWLAGIVGRLCVPAFRTFP